MTASAHPTRAPSGRRWTHYLLPIYTVVLLTFLFAPIAVMIAFSFNDPAGRQNITWQGFTVDNYLDIWSRPQITGPMVTSLGVAAVSTLLATAFGTMIAFALARYRFAGRGALNLLIFVPMTAPEIIGAGNPQVQMIGNVIQFKYINANDYPAAAALAFVLVIGVTVLVAAYSRAIGTDRLTT